jgi:hypothetical protein
MTMESNEVKCAYADSLSDFDKILPVSLTSLNIVPKRLTLQTNRNTFKTIELSNNNEYAQHIYKTIALGLASDWYANSVDVTKRNVNCVLAHFIKWLNTYEISEDNRYKLIKLYESKRTNEDGVKPQSSGLRIIIPTLREGSYNTSLDQKTAMYINELLKSTTASINDESKPITLSAFFSSMPWLREEMGEENYLKLESPKRLIESFSITISVTLLFIIEAKKQAQLRLKNPSELQTSNAKNPLELRNSYSRRQLEKLGSLDTTGQPVDDLTRLIIADCVPLDRQDKLLSIWQSLKPGKRLTDRYRQFFIESQLLTIEHWNKPSPIEQLLFSWLCAIQMIQPNDIGKLKLNNFTVVRNEHGRPQLIQCNYYKGRSGREQEPPVLEASSSEGRAILAYLDYAKSASSALCEAPKPLHLSNFLTSVPVRLLSLWSDENLNSRICEKMIQRKSSPLFLRAYKAMLRGSKGCIAWRIRNKGGIKAYRQKVSRPLPYILFGTTAVKTSAVHARSDKYRESDLINQNSHSNQTEKAQYLTDANKDWVNQNGRITRLVLFDIERYVYRPNLDAAIQQVHEDLLRTHVINAIDAGIDNDREVKINSLGRMNLRNDEIEDWGVDGDSIVVLDTQETVINMLHFISEAERQQDVLIMNALHFFERTILPSVEWMHVVINRMSPTTVQHGERTYKEIQGLLPPLFSNELRAGTTS